MFHCLLVTNQLDKDVINNDVICAVVSDASGRCLLRTNTIFNVSFL